MPATDSFAPTYVRWRGRVSVSKLSLRQAFVDAWMQMPVTVVYLTM